MPFRLRAAPAPLFAYANRDLSRRARDGGEGDIMHWRARAPPLDGHSYPVADSVRRRSRRREPHTRRWRIAAARGAGVEARWAVWRDTRSGDGQRKTRPRGAKRDSAVTSCWGDNSRWRGGGEQRRLCGGGRHESEGLCRLRRDEGGGTGGWRLSSSGKSELNENDGLDVEHHPLLPRGKIANAASLLRLNWLMRRASLNSPTCGSLVWMIATSAKSTLRRPVRLQGSEGTRSRAHEFGNSASASAYGSFGFSVFSSSITVSRCSHSPRCTLLYREWDLYICVAALPCATPGIGELMAAAE
ncbi:hypothetical protein DFH09DRAFT_1146742 [Mycena vulgaris]|nr:hypothetical protein DFH09DRAFT_1146742 [Mycena vulgaris]